MSAYSSKSLIEKLGYKKDQESLVLSAPEGYQIKSNGNSPYDFMQFFTKSEKELEEKFPELRDQLKKTGSLWISWPKKSSKAESDLDENIVMEVGLENGMVDVKVISVDEIWSGLKFVFRLKDR